MTGSSILVSYRNTGVRTWAERKQGETTRRMDAGCSVHRWGRGRWTECCTVNTYLTASGFLASHQCRSGLIGMPPPALSSTMCLNHYVRSKRRRVTMSVITVGKGNPAAVACSSFLPSPPVVHPYISMSKIEVDSAIVTSDDVLVSESGSGTWDAGDKEVEYRCVIQ
ncbi:hypothetical protein C8R44DRAFT_731148 [Mycena epipterygia]|nr:hypothetical protein C8R44DRAFT_731148 [Mycena epipterygia]